MRLPCWVPFVRGDDGLTYRERRAVARRYRRTAARRPTPEEVRAVRRLLAVRRQDATQGSASEKPAEGDPPPQ